MNDASNRSAFGFPLPPAAQEPDEDNWPAPVLHWPLAPLAQTLGFTVQAVGDITSTNTVLMHRARAGRLPQPVLLAAERQSAARGRMGRAWQTGMTDEPGSALAFSLALPLHPQSWSGLSLAIGLAIAESLHPDIRLKWPNDLWLWDGRQGRKLGGILIETATPPGAGDGDGGDAPTSAHAHGGAAASRIAVIGVGINIAPVVGSAGFSTPPAALRELLPGLDAPGALARIAPPLTAAARAFEREGFAPLMARYAARDLLAGQWVRCSDGTEGQAQGIGPDGALRLMLSGGALREIASAEVSVRPTGQVG